MAGSGKPKNQFSRPGIDLDRAENRSWQSVPWDEVYEDDMVADLGRVISRTENDRGHVAEIGFLSGVTLSSPRGKVLAFVRIDG